MTLDLQLSICHAKRVVRHAYRVLSMVNGAVACGMASGSVAFGLATKAGSVFVLFC